MEISIAKQLELTKRIVFNKDSIEFWADRRTFRHNNDILDYITNEIMNMQLDINILFHCAVLQNYAKLFDSKCKISIIGHASDFTDFSANTDNIHEIDIWNINNIDCLSRDSFKNLRELEIHNSNLTIFPELLTNFTELTDLFLIDCKISYIPNSINKLTNLIRLMLDRNNITEFPEVLQNLNLRMISIPHNPVTKIPDFVKNMNLRHLDIDSTNVEILPKNLKDNIFGIANTPLYDKLKQYNGKSRDYQQFSNLMHVVNYTITYLAIVHNMPLDVVSLVARSVLRA